MNLYFCRKLLPHILPTVLQYTAAVPRALLPAVVSSSRTSSSSALLQVCSALSKVSLRYFKIKKCCATLIDRVRFINVLQGLLRLSGIGSRARRSRSLGRRRVPAAARRVSVLRRLSTTAASAATAESGIHARTPVR
ncbi:unnamed protein product [Trichogramma brassicae]|uniref:Uncharacterized protein n=1 Tax=Trichogramma brassicae TaxID=86971 RepID=A0A6H5J5E6_9HYME|nr:unnamed protein product [Trichogramma brassicae]